MTRTMCFGLIGWLALALASPLVAQPFTYQGFPKQNGQPVNGATSLTFRLYTAPTGGSQIGSAITQTVNVQNGLFTVELNFGNVWTGADRYLEIEVAGNTLSPRVKITPAPYASFASSAGFAQRPWQTSGSNIFYTDGNVGIGTNAPLGELHVSAPIVQLDQETAASFQFSEAGDFWQSFTPSITGALTKVALRLAGGPGGSIRVRIRAGEGLSGTLLAERFVYPTASESQGWYEVPLPPVNLTAGQKYTVEAQLIGCLWAYRTDNPYAGGRSSQGSNNDFLLRTYMQVGVFDGLMVSASGVGIGTTTPFACLSLGGGNANTKLAIWQGANTGEVMGLGVGPDQFRLHLHNPNNRFSFLNAPAGTEIMTIRGNGLVGIGTTNPSVRLHLVGSLRVDDGEIQSWGPITIRPDVDNTGDDVVRFVDSTGNETMRIHSNSNVGIGTTSPRALLEVRSNAITGAIITNISGGYFSDWPGTWQGGLATWDICANRILATKFRTASDERLKRDIQPLDASWELQRLMSLRPVSYYWRDEQLSQERQYGFIAQDLREVFPELVLESINEQKTLSVNFQALFPLLVNALQVQQRTLEQQQAEIRQLREELQQLRALLSQKR
jgi:hypothetical protein